MQLPVEWSLSHAVNKPNHITMSNKLHRVINYQRLTATHIATITVSHRLYNYERFTDMHISTMIT